MAYQKPVPFVIMLAKDKMKAYTCKIIWENTYSENTSTLIHVTNHINHIYNIQKVSSEMNSVCQNTITYTSSAEFGNEVEATVL